MNASVITEALAGVLIGLMFIGWFVVSYWFLTAVGRGVDRLIERRMAAHRRRLADPGGRE